MHQGRCEWDSDWQRGVSGKGEEVWQAGELMGRKEDARRPDAQGAARIVIPRGLEPAILGPALRVTPH